MKRPNRIVINIHFPLNLILKSYCIKLLIEFRILNLEVFLIQMDLFLWIATILLVFVRCSPCRTFQSHSVFNHHWLITCTVFLLSEAWFQNASNYHRLFFLWMNHHSFKKGHRNTDQRLDLNGATFSWSLVRSHQEDLYLNTFLRKPIRLDFYDHLNIFQENWLLWASRTIYCWKIGDLRALISSKILLGSKFTAQE